MYQFEKQFDGCCDDVFQNVHLTRAFGDTRPSVVDMIGRLTVALLSGQSLVVPASFLIDHAPLRSLLGSYDWCTFLFNAGLLKVSCEQRSWDAFADLVSGGTPDGPPTVMASDYSASQRLIELWRRAPAEACDAYQETFPFVRDVLERLKVFAPIGGPHVMTETPRVSYQRCLRIVLDHYEKVAEDSSFIGPFRKSVPSVVNRGNALRAIDTLLAMHDVSDAAADELRRLTTVSKHLEMLARLGLASAKTYGGNGGRDNRTGPFTRQTISDAPILSMALSGELGLEDLRAVANDPVFAEARDRFLRLRRERGRHLVEAGMAAAETCRAAGRVLGRRAAEGTIDILRIGGQSALGAGLGLGASLFVDPSAAGAMPGTIFVSGLGLLLLAAARPVQTTVNSVIGKKWLAAVKDSTRLP